MLEMPCQTCQGIQLVILQMTSRSLIASLPQLACLIALHIVIAMPMITVILGSEEGIEHMGEAMEHHILLHLFRISLTE
uniref:Uncharacterized protein n=1 Tax=Rhizophora mucronata TaxID=61149 RepID=A0A2P2Q690_RHIMU